MKPIGLAVTTAALALVASFARAQTITVDASEAIREIHMSDLVSSGDQMQQQRFGSMMLGLGTAGGGAIVSGAPPMSSGDMSALQQKVRQLDSFAPDPAVSQALARDLASRYARDRAARTEYVRLFGRLTDDWHASARKLGLGLGRETYLAGAYLYLFQIAYFASNPESAGSLTGSDVRRIAQDFQNVSAAQQLKAGRALGEREKQRTYDTLGVVATTLELSRRQAKDKHDDALDAKVRAAGNAVLLRLYGVKSQAPASEVIATLNAAGRRVSMPLVAQYREVLSLH